MRALFLSITALVSMLTVAPVTARADQPCVSDRCIAMHAATPKGKIPYPHPRTCFYIEQDAREATPLFVYSGTGKLLDEGNPDHHKVKGTSDSYCIGSHYVADVLADGGWIILCNHHWTSHRIEGAELRGYYEAGDAPQTLRTTVCLMDGAACDRRLALKKVPD
ncbi:MAG TPA: hypothetical protein VFL98_01350 [Candidatus Paceibacterota bacterium]|nr:hypothetical protein [Candidatus Paceibacterota bacterium]